MIFSLTKWQFSVVTLDGCFHNHMFIKTTSLIKSSLLSKDRHMLTIIVGFICCSGSFLSCFFKRKKALLIKYHVIVLSTLKKISLTSKKKKCAHAVPFRASHTFSLYMKEAGNLFDFYHVTIKIIQYSIIAVYGCSIYLGDGFIFWMK